MKQNLGTGRSVKPTVGAVCEVSVPQRKGDLDPYFNVSEFSEQPLPILLGEFFKTLQIQFCGNLVPQTAQGKIAERRFRPLILWAPLL